VAEKQAELSSLSGNQRFTAIHGTTPPFPFTKRTNSQTMVHEKNQF